MENFKVMLNGKGKKLLVVINFKFKYTGDVRKICRNVVFRMLNMIFQLFEAIYKRLPRRCTREVELDKLLVTA